MADTAEDKEYELALKILLLPVNEEARNAASEVLRKRLEKLSHPMMVMPVDKP